MARNRDAPKGLPGKLVLVTGWNGHNPPEVLGLWGVKGPILPDLGSKEGSPVPEKAHQDPLTSMKVVGEIPRELL